MGPEGRADRAEEPRRHAYGSDRRRLRGHLAAHLLGQRRRSGLIFGRTETRTFDDRALAIRATKAWTAAKLTPITLHGLRHSCASIFIAAGMNAKALSSYLGHAPPLTEWPSA